MIRSLLHRLRFDLAAYERGEQARQRNEARMHLEAKRLLASMPGIRCAPGAGDLVLGLAAHYQEQDLRPFVLSLRRSGYSGRVVLLTFGCDADTARFLRQQKVEMVAFGALCGMPMSMNSSRMFGYLDLLLSWLQNHGEVLPVERILLCDVRDVVFQGDPFHGMPADSRLVYHLESGRTLGTCDINRDWLLRAYGPEVARTLADRPVSCAGTLHGRADAVLEYLVRMVDAILNVAPAHRFSGIDQAIHNVICAQGLVEGTVGLANGEGVYTVSERDGAPISWSEQRLLDDRGRAHSVVHQFDRNAEVLAAVQRHFNKSY